MIEIEATCTTCGHVFRPSHDACVRGDWRTCLRCRDRAERLADLADAPPAPLPRHWGRDGPDRHPESFTAPKRADGAHSTPPAYGWNHRSKGN